jgi:signal transduction histidine kinase
MNRLWMRISISFTLVVIFAIVLPLVIGITLQSFNIDNPDFPAKRFQEFFRLNPEGEDEVPGFFLLAGLTRLFVIVTILGVIAGVLVSRGLTAPLNRLADAARAIGERDLSQRVEIRGSDEIQAVAQAFNEMAAELENAETLRQNLLTDVAHELRTPITVIQGNLRAILDDVYDLDKAEIAKLYDQTRQLSRLVDDLRELAQAEANQLPLDMASVDMGVLVEEVSGIYEPIAEAEGIELRYDLLNDLVPIKGDRARLTQCLQNLLNNAIRHTPEGGTVVVKLWGDKKNIHLSVADTGSGIASEHLPHVFDRFYRADPARTRETGSTGLGLAITRAIVEAHGGEISATSEGVGKGSLFSVKLHL